MNPPDTPSHPPLSSHEETRIALGMTVDEYGQWLDMELMAAATENAIADELEVITLVSGLISKLCECGCCQEYIAEVLQKAADHLARTTH